MGRACAPMTGPSHPIYSELAIQTHKRKPTRSIKAIQFRADFLDSFRASGGKTFECYRTDLAH